MWFLREPFAGIAWNRVLLNHAPTSTQSHPSPPSSTHLYPAPSSSTQLQLAHLWYIGGPGSGSGHTFLKFRPPKICFWANLFQKAQSCQFWMNIGTYNISRMVILMPTLVFWIYNPKSVFGQIWSEKNKAACFAWKLTHMASWRCWFRIQS